jgi:hypothetical protein
MFLQRGRGAVNTRVYARAHTQGVQFIVNTGSRSWQALLLQRPYAAGIQGEHISCNVTCLLISLGGVKLSPLGTSVTIGLQYQSRMIDDTECGAVGEMKTGSGNRNKKNKAIPVTGGEGPPPQIPHYLTWDRTGAAAMGTRRVTAWAMGRALKCHLLYTTVSKFGTSTCKQASPGKNMSPDK